MKSNIYDIAYALFVVAGLISLAIHYPAIVIPVYIFLAVLVLLGRKSTSKKSEQYRSAFDAAFEGADCIPEYKQGWSYSYPSFQLTFSNKEECDQYLQNERTMLA